MAYNRFRNGSIAYQIWVHHKRSRSLFFLCNRDRPLLCMWYRSLKGEWMPVGSTSNSYSFVYHRPRWPAQGYILMTRARPVFRNTNDIMGALRAMAVYRQKNWGIFEYCVLEIVNTTRLIHEYTFVWDDDRKPMILFAITAEKYSIMNICMC